jgi:hypothetical protein
MFDLIIKNVKPKWFNKNVNDYFALFKLMNFLNSGCYTFFSIFEAEWGVPFGASLNLYGSILYIFFL